MSVYYFCCLFKVIIVFRDGRSQGTRAERLVDSWRHPARNAECVSGFQACRRTQRSCSPKISLKYCATCSLDHCASAQQDSENIHVPSVSDLQVAWTIFRSWQGLCLGPSFDHGKFLLYSLGDEMYKWCRAGTVQRAETKIRRFLGALASSLDYFSGLGF